MALGKSVVIVVWTTLICGRVLLVSGKPQQRDISSTSSSSDLETSIPVTAVGKTKGFEVKHGFSVNVANSANGPYGSGWTYLGGNVGPGPTYLTDNTGFLPTDLWSGNAIDLITSGLYATAAVVALSSLYYTFAGAAKQLIGLGTTEKESKKVSKSRRRRDVHMVQADADLTRLTSIVLNAIASGECLQKSICELGTQIGASPKGRIAFNLLDTLLPPSVHTNQYFVTMKKALKGDSQCEKFRCHNNF